MRHVAKSGFGQCECYWCGRRPRFSPECGATDEIRKAVRDFAAANGRTWKSKLRAAWESGAGTSPELQQARNVIGPRRLDKISAKLLARVPE